MILTPDALIERMGDAYERALEAREERVLAWIGDPRGAASVEAFLGTTLVTATEQAVADALDGNSHVVKVRLELAPIAQNILVQRPQLKESLSESDRVHALRLVLERAGYTHAFDGCNTLVLQVKVEREDGEEDDAQRRDDSDLPTPEDLDVLRSGVRALVAAIAEGTHDARLPALLRGEHARSGGGRRAVIQALSMRRAGAYSGGSIEGRG